MTRDDIEIMVADMGPDMTDQEKTRFVSFLMRMLGMTVGGFRAEHAAMKHLLKIAREREIRDGAPMNSVIPREEMNSIFEQFAALADVDLGQPQ